MPCRYHVRLKTSVYLLSGNTAQVAGSTRATGEYNISGTYYLDNETQSVRYGHPKLLFAWEAPVPCKSKAGTVKVTTHLVKYLKHLKHNSYQTSLLVSRHTM